MSFATRVNTPSVLFDVQSIVESKNRINNLVKKYQKQIRASKDDAYKASKQQKVDILKDILKRERQAVREVLYIVSKIKKYPRWPIGLSLYLLRPDLEQQRYFSPFLDPTFFLTTTPR